jgi:putative DNA primase/helicase
VNHDLRAEKARRVTEEGPGEWMHDEPAGGRVIPASWTDAHVAEVLADHLQGRWLYVAAWGRWLRWDGTRWAHDDTEAVHEEARSWVIELVATVAAIGASADDVKRAATYRNRSKLESAMTMARRVQGIAASPSEFDLDPDLLNVANGVLDLRTGNLLEHDPARRITKLAPVEYDIDAQHRDVDELLEVVDADVRPWLQRVFGYAATGHTSEDLALVLDGTGANGKTTLLEAVGSVLGDYAGAVAPQLVMKTSHDQHPTVKADLRGKRLVWISETEEGGALRVEQVKALTGGDQISARFMYGDLFTFAPSHLLVIATNHRPSVNTTEHAAWRRLRLVPFPHTYKPEHEAGPGDRVQDRGLRHRLATGRAQREALLAWIVRGAFDWNQSGLGACGTVDAATAAWKLREDVLGRFIAEVIEFDPHSEVKGKELYLAYKDWCTQEGRPAKSNKNFAADFTEHQVVIGAGIEKVTRHQVAHYRGLKVRFDAAF